MTEIFLCNEQTDSLLFIVSRQIWILMKNKKQKIEIDLSSCVSGNNELIQYKGYCPNPVFSLHSGLWKWIYKFHTNTQKNNWKKTGKEKKTCVVLDLMIHRLKNLYSASEINRSKLTQHTFYLSICSIHSQILIWKHYSIYKHLAYIASFCIFLSIKIIDQTEVAEKQKKSSKSL